MQSKCARRQAGSNWVVRLNVINKCTQLEAFPQNKSRQSLTEFHANFIIQSGSHSRYRHIRMHHLKLHWNRHVPWVPWPSNASRWSMQTFLVQTNEWFSKLEAIHTSSNSILTMGISTIPSRSLLHSCSLPTLGYNNICHAKCIQIDRNLVWSILFFWFFERSRVESMRIKVRMKINGKYGKKWNEKRGPTK